MIDLKKKIENGLHSRIKAQIEKNVETYIKVRK